MTYTKSQAPAAPSRPARKSPLRAATLGGIAPAGTGLTTAEILAAGAGQPREAIPAPDLRRMQISEFTACDTATLNRFFADYLAGHGQRTCIRATSCSCRWPAARLARNSGTIKATTAATPASAARAGIGHVRTCATAHSTPARHATSSSHHARSRSLRKCIRCCRRITGDSLADCCRRRLPLAPPSS
jgi:hypothetical protein